MKSCIIIVIFLIGILDSNGQNPISSSNKIDQDTASAKICNDTLSLIDLEVNNYFQLLTKRGIKNTIGEKAFKKLSKTFVNELVLLNRNKSQFLHIRLVFLGDRNARIIESGYISQITTGDRYKTNFSEFETNRGVKLGMKEAEFVALTKPLRYQILINKVTKTYHYSSSTLLKNIGLYDAEYIFENRKLIWWKFGIDY